ncbi:hypothetical protein BU15DRAFT_65113 [Melanogaster broomeanus]|nr:hypothetical protein BU15DRAFT_65113 [Melanogaster broomeanus]
MPKVKSYLCDCRKHGYEPTGVSRPTWYRHKTMREESNAVAYRLLHLLESQPDPSQEDSEPAEQFKSANSNSPQFSSASEAQKHQRDENPFPTSVFPSIQTTPGPRAAGVEDAPDEDDASWDIEQENGEGDHRDMPASPRTTDRDLPAGSERDLEPPVPRPADPDEAELLKTIWESMAAGLLATVMRIRNQNKPSHVLLLHSSFAPPAFS